MKYNSDRIQVSPSSFSMYITSSNVDRGMIPGSDVDVRTKLASP